MCSTCFILLEYRIYVNTPHFFISYSECTGKNKGHDRRTAVERKERKNKENFKRSCYITIHLAHTKAN
jgi:hypothetical protein